MHEMIKRFLRAAIYIAAVGFQLAAATHAQEPRWLRELSSVQPLVDDRQAVRERFGEPLAREENRDFFTFSGGKLVAVYSSGECSTKELHGEKLRVAKNTLLRLDFDVPGEVKFSSLRLDLRGFQRTVPGDTPDLTIYTNTRRGIRYVRFRNRLSDVEITPPGGVNSYSCATVRAGEQPVPKHSPPPDLLVPREKQKISGKVELLSPASVINMKAFSGI